LIDDDDDNDDKSNIPAFGSCLNLDLAQTSSALMQRQGPRSGREKDAPSTAMYKDAIRNRLVRTREKL